MQTVLEKKEGILACKEIVNKILCNEIKNLEKEKIFISRKYKLGKILKNADIIVYCQKIDHPEKRKLGKFLRTKPVRTLSGVASIAIMWLGENNYSCPFSCIYCPQGETQFDGKKIAAPKSYIGVEPTTLRAIRNKYDPYKQVSNRLRQFKIIGHPTDKCELIIMGGTFLAWGQQNYTNFVKRAFDAFNEEDSKNLEEAKKKNETAANRIVGLTIETRADYCRDFNIKEMLRLGATRVEIGVQTTDEKLLEKTKRGHGAEENKKAFKKLRDAGLKITAHWMPGLTGMNGIDVEKEAEDFKKLFSDPSYRPDELKIYPTLVIPGTELYELWKAKKYDAMNFDQTIKLLSEIKKIVPKYVRIKRIMRDISEHESEAGAKTTNLRQLLHEKMKQKNIFCRCIRCREVGHKIKAPKNVQLLTKKYEASGGEEFFISFEDIENDILVGFIRLRIDDSDFAKVRELHVYGKMIPIDKKSDSYQHTGYGKKLLVEAEKIAKKFSKNVQITSGVGAREYYKKLGYKFLDPYMVKLLR